MTEALQGASALALGVSAGDCLLVIWRLPTVSCCVRQPRLCSGSVSSQAPWEGGEKPWPPPPGALTELLLGEEGLQPEPQLSGFCKEASVRWALPLPWSPPLHQMQMVFLRGGSAWSPLCKVLRGPPQGPLSLSLALKDRC